MLRLAADEKFNNDIVRGLLRRKPDLDIVCVQALDFLELMMQVFWSGLRKKTGYYLCDERWRSRVAK